MLLARIGRRLVAFDQAAVAAHLGHAQRVIGKHPSSTDHLRGAVIASVSAIVPVSNPRPRDGAVAVGVAMQAVEVDHGARF